MLASDLTITSLSCTGIVCRNERSEGEGGVVEIEEVGLIGGCIKRCMMEEGGRGDRKKGGRMDVLE